MRVRETAKKEIADKLMTLGDYVKMEYLESCLQNRLDFDTRKFVMVKLSGLYEVRNMFLDAGRIMLSSAEINTTERDKINDFVKAAELFVLAGSHDDADISLKKALSLAGSARRNEIELLIKESYKMQAKKCIEKNKRKKALQIYEKLLTFQLEEVERKDVSRKLLDLYDKLGRVREYYALKRQLA